ncbi:hypothetical protein HK097_004756, partial [Rhizophlyctis rosea]
YRQVFGTMISDYPLSQRTSILSKAKTYITHQRAVSDPHNRLIEEPVTMFYNSCGQVLWNEFNAKWVFWFCEGQDGEGFGFVYGFSVWGGGRGGVELQWE